MDTPSPAPTRRRRWPRRAAVLAAAALLLPPLAVQTPPGKAALAAAAAWAVDRFAGYTLHVRGVSGVVPFALRVDTVEVGDGDGVFATLGGLALDLRAAPLLRGGVHVVSIRAAEARVLRAPRPDPPPEPKPYALPTLPAPPAWLRVDEIAIGQLRLDEDLAGVAADFALAGGFGPGRDGARWGAALDLRRLDAPTTRAEFALRVDADAARLIARADDDSLLPALTGIPGPFALALSGTGPPDAWSGTVAFDAGGARALDGTLGLRAADADTALEARLEVDPVHPVMPPALAEWLGDTLKVVLHARLAPEGVVHFDALRADAPRAVIGIGGSVDTRGQSLNLTIAATLDGAAARLGLDTGGAEDRAAARVRVAGPLDALEIPLRATWDNAQVIDADLRVALGTGVAVSGTLLVQPPDALLPENLRGRFAEGIRGGFALRRTPDGAVDLTRADFTFAENRVEAAGLIDTASERAALRATLALDDLAAIGAIFGLPMQGVAAATLDATASRGGLLARVALDATKPAYGDGLRADAITLEFDAASDAWIPADLSGLRATGQARVAGLRAADVPPTDWTADFDLAALDAARVALRALELRGGGIALRANGEAHAGNRAGRVSATIDAEDLSTAAALAGVELAGGLALRIEAEAGADGGARAVWEGEARNLRGTHPLVAALAGARLESTGAAAYADGTIRVTDAVVAGGAARIEASLEFIPESGGIEMRAQARVPDLAPIGAAFDQDVGGRLTARAEARGTLADLALTLDAEADAPRVGARPMDRAAVSLAITGAPGAPAGTLALEADTGPARLRGQSRIAYDGTTLRLDGIALDAGDNRVRGDAALVPASGAGRATLDAKLPDLAGLGAAIGFELAGSAELSADFDTMGPDPRLRADARASKLRVSGAAVGGFDLEMHVADPLGSPAFGLRANAEAIEIAAAAVRRATLESKGDWSAAAFTLSAGGALADAGAFRLDAAGDAAPGDGAMSLSRLDGDLGGVPVALVQPLRIAWRDGAGTLSGLAMEIGGGQLTADARLGSEGVEATAAARGFPLAIAAALGGPDLEGTLDADAAIAGTLDAPLGRVEARIAGLRFDGLAKDSPPLALEARADLGAERWRAGLRLELPGTMAWAAETTVPAGFAPGDWEALPLEATLRGEADLAGVARALDLKDHVVNGALRADLALGGTPARPMLRGGVHVDGADYENALTGTILRDIVFALEASGGDLRIVEARANDGAGGTLRAGGGVVLDFANGLPFTVNTTLENARLVHRDDLSARVAGTLEVAGSLRGIDVAGDLLIGPARYVLPERLPPAQLAAVEVVEVNHPDPAARAAPPPAAPPLPVRLDVRCRIPGRVVIRGPVLDTEWGGDLRVRGTADAPRVEGTLGVVRGHLDFLGRRFDLRESTIAFDGGPALNPYVNVAARSETRRLEAILRVTGTPDTLAFDLTSTPVFPQDEVLAQVLFNRGVNELTPVQAIQLARAATLLGGNVAGLRFLSGNLGIGALDTFDIRAGDDPGEVVVGVGKYITDKIYAEVEQGTGPKSTTVQVNIELSPRFSVEAETGASAEAGIGVFYKRDY